MCPKHTVPSLANDTTEDTEDVFPLPSTSIFTTSIYYWMFLATSIIFKGFTKVTDFSL